MDQESTVLTKWLQAYMEEDNKVEPDIEGLQSGLSSKHRLKILTRCYKGTSLFHKAIQLNHGTIVKLLLKTLSADDIITLSTIKDGDYPSYTHIHYTALYNRHEILRDILRCVRAAGKSTLPLLLICYNARIRYTVAHIAAEKDHWQMLECMLDSLETPEEKLQLITTKSSGGYTVLCRAVEDNSIQTVKVIVKHLTGDHLYQAMKIKNIYGTVLYLAAYFDRSDIVSILMNPLTHRQRLELLEMTNRWSSTPRDVAKLYGSTEIAEQLRKLKTTALIEITKSASNDKEAGEALEVLRFEELLDSQQILTLYPYSQQYMIPRNQEKIKQHALILYREEGREDGARNEAYSFSEAMGQAGCDVTIKKWSTHIELKVLMKEGLVSKCATSSLFIICLMSHGSEGCIEGTDGEVSINSLLQLITPATLQPHIPLVMMIQACQVSQDRYSIGHDHLTDPATVAQGACAALSQRHTITSEERKVDLRREHTILIQTSLPGQVSYRGEYLQEMGNQMRQSGGILTINNMHERAVYEMERRNGPGGTPKVTSTLMKSLVLPGTD